MKILWIAAHKSSAVVFSKLNEKFESCGINGVVVSPRNSLLRFHLRIYATLLQAGEKLTQKFFPKVSSWFLAKHWRLISQSFQLQHHESPFTHVFLFCDRILARGLIPAAILFAKRNQLPIIIPPHGHVSDIPSVIGQRKDPRFEYDRLPRELREFAVPFNSTETGKKVVFYPEKYLRTLASLGIRHSNPWVIGASHADALMVDSLYERKRFIEDNMTAQKIFVTGQLVHDEIYRQKHQRDEIQIRLRQKNNLLQEKAIIFLALPQLLEHGLTDHSRHWESLRALLETLAPWKDQLVIFLHPKMDVKTYEQFILPLGFRLERSPILDLIVAADVFLSASSSVIQPAASAGIPCLVLDFYGLSTRYYDNNESLLQVKELASLAGILKPLVENEVLRKMLSQKTAEKSQELYGVIDGQAFERIKNVTTNFSGER